MLAPDTVLQNRYRIVRQLGQGGMGRVYEAVDMRFDNQVALKETHFTEEALRKQFEREARLLNRLRHPALARVIDHFTENDGQYLVMDFIEGEDLWEMLEKRKTAFPVDDVLRWADQLLEALDYLHSQEPPVIHRDIKPHNLKLTSRGQIILLDFGLAKGFAGQISRVTTSGSIFGYTPNYAPLEQIHGTGTDARSDLYSLSATLHHLLTGKVPPDALSRALALTSEQPDPLRPANEVNLEVPAKVAEVLQNATEVNLAKRLASAAEMRERLQGAGRKQAPARNELKEAVQPPTLINLAPTEVAQGQEAQPLPPTIAQAADTQQSSKPISTIAAATVASPSVLSASSKAKPLIETSQPFGGLGKSDRKANRRLWLFGTVAVIIISIFIAILALNRNSSDSVQEYSPAEADKRGIAAAVNGKPIMISAVDHLVNQQASSQQIQLTQAESTTARLQVLDSLIQQEVLYQRAEKVGLFPSEDEITQYISNRKKESMTTQEQFEERLKEQNMTPEDLRAAARKEIAIQKLQVRAHSSITVTDRDVEDFYNKNKAEFYKGRGVELSVIVADPAVDNSLTDDAKSESEAKSKIDVIYQQLKNGADFVALARARSEDKDSITKGGNIGFLSEDDLNQRGFPQDLNKQFFVMQVGDITRPVRGGNRWVIFKLMSRNLLKENLTLDSPGVRSQIVDSLIMQRKDAVNAALLEQAKNEAKIVNYLALKT